MCLRTSLSLSILLSISSFRAAFFCSYFPFWVLAVLFCLRFALMVGNSRFELVQYSFLLNFQASDSVEFQLSLCGKCFARFSLGSHFVSRGLPPAVLDSKGGDARERQTRSRPSPPLRCALVKLPWKRACNVDTRLRCYTILLAFSRHNSTAESDTKVAEEESKTRNSNSGRPGGAFPSTIVERIHNFQV
jgi:hypothetical protein